MSSSHAVLCQIYRRADALLTSVSRLLVIYSRSVQLTNCSDASVCPRSPDYVNMTCCDNHQGQQPGLDQARIAASMVSSIRAISSTTSTSSSQETSATAKVIVTSTGIISQTPVAATQISTPSETTGGGGASPNKKTYVIFRESAHSPHYQQPSHNDRQTGFQNSSIFTLPLLAHTSLGKYPR